MNYKNTYKLLLMGGLAPIKMEVCADQHVILDSGVYCFQLNGKNIAYYPLATTIIQDIEENESYVRPPRPPRPDGMDAILRQLRRNDI